MADRDLDVVQLSQDIRSTVDRELQHGVPAGENLVEALGQERAQAIYDHRSDVITDLVRDAAALAAGRDLLLVATDDLQVTGPDVGVDLGGLSEPPDAFVLKCWDDEEAAIARMKAAAARTETRSVADGNRRPAGDRARRLAARLVAAGASQLRYYYHAGLASPARLGAIRTAVQDVV